MTVSVIIPVYNIEHYIEKCLQSVCTQTYQDLQIILVDDGSTDASGEICDKLAALDSRCTVIHQENAKLYGARNTGLGYATGDFVCFIDGDDILHPKMIEVLVDLIQHNKDCDISMIWGEKVYTKEKDLKIEKTYTKQNKSKTYSNKEYLGLLLSDSSAESYQYHVVWNKLYRRTILNGIKFDAVLNEDLVFNYKVASKSRIIAINDSRLYYWIHRETSVSNEKNFYVNPKAILSYIECYNFCPETVDSNLRDLCLDRILKRVLSSRAYFSKNEEVMKELHEMEEKYYRPFLKSNLSMKEKLVISVFLKIPATYKLFQWYCNNKR